MTQATIAHGSLQVAALHEPVEAATAKLWSIDVDLTNHKTISLAVRQSAVGGQGLLVAS